MTSSSDRELNLLNVKASPWISRGVVLYVCIKKQNKPLQFGQISHTAKIALLFSSAYCGERDSFWMLSPLLKHHIQSAKKKKNNTTFPCFPVVLIRHTAQYARDKDPDQTPRTRDPSTRQNLASSVVVKALYLQNKWVRKGFSTECKEWCCIEGYTEVKHIYVTCEWTWRQLTGAETAAMGLTGGYLEEILDHLEGTGRWWKDRSISQYTLGELGLFWTEGSGNLTNVAN